MEVEELKLKNVKLTKVYYRVSIQMLYPTEHFLRKR